MAGTGGGTATGGNGGAVGSGGTIGAGGATATGGRPGSDGGLGSGGIFGAGGTVSRGGATGTGGIAGTGGSVRIDAGNPSDVPLATGGVGGGGFFDAGGVEAPAPDARDTAGAGGVAGTGGVTDGGGTGGTGGTSDASSEDSPGACSPACPVDEDCTNGSCAIRWGGMACTTSQDCPSWATCCDGSTESCDGTRLPSGDGPNTGEFVVSTDGLTVTDTITGLSWQSDGSGTRAGCYEGVGGVGNGNLTCIWPNAKAYCASLTLGGVSGWRLPGAKELATILNLQSVPSIDATAFPNTPQERFWTSSAFASPVASARIAWGIDFKIGGMDICSEDNCAFRARCVRGSRCYPKSRFIPRDGWLVLDILTQLLWDQAASNTTMDWAAAKAYCGRLGRLPSLKELGSLLDLTVTSGSPTIDQTAFPNTPAEEFWTSTQFVSFPSSAATVRFYNGQTPNEPVVGSSFRVRCVR